MFWLIGKRPHHEWCGLFEAPRHQDTTKCHITQIFIYIYFYWYMGVKMERNLLEQRILEMNVRTIKMDEHGIKPFALNYAEDPSYLPVAHMETGTYSPSQKITQKDD